MYTYAVICAYVYIYMCVCLYVYICMCNYYMQVEHHTCLLDSISYRAGFTQATVVICGPSVFEISATMAILGIRDSHVEVKVDL